jgi:hypothetical protein
MVAECGISAALLLFALALFCHHVAAVWGYTVDDSFITFRYSKNIADGMGPVFSAGSRDEGYTSPLWTLLLVLPHLAGLNTEVVSKILGVTCIVGSAGTAAWWLFRLTQNVFVSAVAAALLLCFTPSAVHAISGMETALFTLLLTLFSFLIFESIREPEKQNFAFVGIAALALGLARPEGNLVAVVGIVAAICLLPRAERWQLLKSTALFYMLPGVLYFAWRFQFYGQLMPLPFYLKVGNQTGLAGLRDVRGYLRELDYLAGMLMFFGVLFLAFNKQRGAIPVILAGVAFLWFFLKPAHIMGYQWRYLFPVTPLFFLLAALGIGLIVQSFDLMRVRRFAAPALSCIALLIFSRMQSEAPGVIAGQNGYRDGLNSAHRVLGAQLHNMKTPGVLAIGDAGAVPYLSGWKTIDTFGLNDRHIALHGHDPGYVLRRNPDVIVLISGSKTDFQPPLAHEKPLYESSVKAGFAKLETLEFSPAYFLWVLAKPNTKIAKELDQRQFARH